MERRRRSDESDLSEEIERLRAVIRALMTRAASGGAA